MEFLYRFRPLHRLLIEKELDNQEIYFASPDQLNDPMEGFRDLFWKGDEIVWSNLIAHYVTALDHAYSLMAIGGETEAIKWSHIPLVYNNDLYIEPLRKVRLEKLINEVLQTDEIRDWVRILTQRRIPLRRNELAAHLQGLHLFFISKIYKNFIDHGLIPQNNTSADAENRVMNGVKSALKALAGVSSLEEKGSNPNYDIDDFFVAHHHLVEQTYLIQIYNKSTLSAEANKRFIFFEFILGYVKRLESLVFPEWYAACFMAECNNSSVWGTYGDSHKAVCLKFKTKSTQGGLHFKIKRLTGWSGEGPIVGYYDEPLHRVRYGGKHLPVDFFRSLGRFSIPTLKHYWYGDKAGRQSSCGDDIFYDEDSWRVRYWNNFQYAINSKLSVWKHEKEFRLVLSNTHFDFSNPASRKTQYDFNDLDGIIFGIKTPEKEKIDIMRVIEAKCRSLGRTDFRFYQAYYSRSTGKIEHREMSLMKFETIRPAENE